MRDIHEALGGLLAVQRHTVTAAPDRLADLATVPDATLHLTDRGTAVVVYRVTAPCRLAQLADAVGSSLGAGHGGRSDDSGSPALVSPQALDLWTEIATATAAWAVAVGVDRRLYLRPAVRACAVPGVRRTVPGGVGPLTGHTRPARTILVATPNTPEWAETGTPPLGRLLRVAAAEADRRGYDAMVATIARDSVKWAGRIDVLFGQHALDLIPVRGVRCPDCLALSVVEERDDGEHYRSPALVLVLGSSPYRWCRACDATEWVTEFADREAA